jgi:DNA-binding MltR family transcriptional regulator
MVWWIGGNDEIHKAIQRLETESDRSVGIVAAAILEGHITSAIKRRWHDHPVTIQRMLQIDGPLGNFGPKIDLVFLMGLISPEAHHDLTLIKKVRNKFAHYFDVEGFDTPVIKGWCFDLRYFEKFVLTDAEMQGAPKGTRKLFGSVGIDEKLKTAKGRYLTGVQFYSMLFGPEWPGVYMPPVVKPTPIF